MWIAGLVGGGVLAGWILFGANRRRFAWETPLPLPPAELNGVIRETVFIDTPGGDQIEAWVYRPQAVRPPVIIMAPGLAGTKEGPLERFAQAFAEQGFAALLIDFRTFGGSAGMPRHNVDPRMQVEDYLATVAHVRGAMSDTVDASRIALWGTSFSAAGAACAATEAHPQALLLHVPYTGEPAHPPGPFQMTGYVGLVVAEKVGDVLVRFVRLRLPPAYITAYCQPGERAFGASTQCPSRRDGRSDHPFWRLLPETYRGGWRNMFLVRALAHLSDTDPQAAIRAALQPTLIVGATQDDMIAIGGLRQLQRTAPDRIEMTELEAGHFDPYADPVFAPNLAVQLDFLRRHLSRD